MKTTLNWNRNTFIGCHRCIRLAPNCINNIVSLGSQPRVITVLKFQALSLRIEVKEWHDEDASHYRCKI